MRNMFRFNLDCYVPFSDKSGMVFVNTNLLYVPDKECFLISNGIGFLDKRYLRGGRGVRYD